MADIDQAPVLTYEPGTHPDHPPPGAFTVGRVPGWLRENLFSSPGSTSC